MRKREMASPVQWLSDEAYRALPAGERGLVVASTQVGVEEVGGNNRGAAVEGYLSAAGAPAGSPWCAAFVYWCLLQAGANPRVLPARGRAASVFAWREWARLGKRTVLVPERGRLFFWLDRRGSPPQWQGHIGFCAGRADGRGAFRTIEGNTDGGEGSRDGDGVYRRARSLSELQAHDSWGFIDLGRTN